MPKPEPGDEPSPPRFRGARRVKLAGCSLPAHEAGKAAFHRVPDFGRHEWDAVEPVLTELGAVACQEVLGQDKLLSSSAAFVYRETERLFRASRSREAADQKSATSENQPGAPV